MSEKGRPKLLDREKVLEAAIDAFWETGYSETSIRDIGSRCGTGLQSLYNEFGDKPSLYLAALERYMATRFAGPSACVTAGERALDGLRAMIDAMEAFHSGQSRGCLVVLTLADFGPYPDDAIAKAARGYIRRMERLLLAALDRAKEQGDLPRDRNTHELASAMLALLNGIALFSRANVDRAIVRDSFTALRGLLS